MLQVQAFDRLQVAWPSVFCRVSIGAPKTLKIRFLANQVFHVFNVGFRDERLSPLKSMSASSECENIDCVQS